MNKSVRLSISSLLAIGVSIVVLLAGILSSSDIAILPSGSLAVLLVTLLLVLALIYFGHPRTKKWKPEAGGFKGIIPAAPWGNLPFGVFLGLVLGGLFSYLVTGSEATTTGIGTSLYPDEIASMAVGVLLGILYAIMIDARLAAGMLLGYGLGLPTALIILNPGLHELKWSYGGYIAIFGGLAVLHLLLKPMLDKVKKP